MYLRKKNTIEIKEIILFIIALILAALSGHRGSIITIISTAFFAIIFSNSEKTKKIFLLTRMFYLIIIFSLIFILVTNEIPDVIKRSLSFIPGIENIDAKGSSSWRLDVWDLAFRYELPNFLLFGKGLATSFSKSNLPFILSDNETYISAIDNLNYHSGPISIVIGLGLPFFILIVLLHFKIVKLVLNSMKSVMKLRNSYFAVLLGSTSSIYFTQLIFYLFIYGDLTNAFIRVHFFAALSILIINFNNNSEISDV